MNRKYLMLPMLALAFGGLGIFISYIVVKFTLPNPAPNSIKYSWVVGGGLSKTPPLDITGWFTAEITITPTSDMKRLELKEVNIIIAEKNCLGEFPCSSGLIYIQSQSSKLPKDVYTTNVQLLNEINFKYLYVETNSKYPVTVTIELK